MKPEPFALERYFARYEFTTRYLLCSSDPEAMTIRDLLALEPGGEEVFAKTWLGYTQSPGDPELRALIASTYDAIDADRVLVHGGAQEAIFTFMNVALQSGDHVIVQFPAYPSHYSIAESLGVEVSRWNSDLSGGGAPDPDELARLIRSSTRAIVITTPNNPTGCVFDRERLHAVVAFARKHGLWLFSDEVYRGSERDPADRHQPVSDLYERGISLGGTAKVHGLAGLRIGWIASRDASFVEQLATFKDYLTICNSAPSEFLAKVAIRNQSALFERFKRITMHNLDVLDAFFAQHNDLFEWHRPRAGSTAFPRYRGGSAERFCADLVKRAGVLLLPSTIFDAGDDRFRIGYGRKNLPEALAAFGDYLSSLNARV
jgi:aspartate/methionine/tyrosine aminotransferase